MHAKTLKRSWVWLASVLALLVIAWAFIPWQWSTIDDPGFALWVHDVGARQGAWMIPWEVFRGQVQTDLQWGLFRPAFWIYPVLYVLPAWAMHALRLLMFAAAVAGPVVALRREKRITPETTVAAVALMLLAGTALSRGLFFLSLQELSGAAFVGLGLLVRGYRPRTLFWLIAAWFKSPFSWLLLGNALLLWRQGKRGWAVANAALGFATLGAGLLLARNGNYTGRYFPTTLYGIADTVFNNADNLLGVLSAGLLAGLVWWLLISGARLHLNSLSLAVGIGFVGYSAQMLLWETSGYYLGPILFLAGASLVMSMESPPPISRTVALVAVSGAWALVTVLVGGALIQGVESNQVIRSLVSCVSRTSGANWALIGDYPYVFTEEGGVRIGQMTQMQSPGWTGQIALQSVDDFPSGESRFAIVGPGTDLAPFQGMAQVCSGTKVTVFERRF